MQPETSPELATGLRDVTTFCPVVIFRNNFGHTLGEQVPTMHLVLCERLGRCSHSPEVRLTCGFTWLPLKGRRLRQQAKDQPELASCLSR